MNRSRILKPMKVRLYITSDTDLNAKESNGKASRKDSREYPELTPNRLKAGPNGYKSDRRMKLDVSLGFDYYEHSMAIYEVYNKFRKNPLKYFKKLYKQAIISDEDFRYLKQLDDQKTGVSWSDEAYKCLYRNLSHSDEVILDDDELAMRFPNRCRVVSFYISGEYDPEMTMLMIIKENLDRINLLIDDYEIGTVCSYNVKPDVICFYLIKVF
jgi:hypothetical protein